MASVLEKLLSSMLGGAKVDEIDELDREAHRLYLAAKIELLEEKIKITKETIETSIKDHVHNISPYMRGFIEGMQRSIAFITGVKKPFLQRPLIYYNNPELERKILMIHKMRRETRRKVTAFLWNLMWSQGYFDGTTPPHLVERMVRKSVVALLGALPPAYKFRMQRKRLIESTGVNYEEVRNAQSLEGRWT